jgi:hypothetical protein
VLDLILVIFCGTQKILKIKNWFFPPMRRLNIFLSLYEITEKGKRGVQPSAVFLSIFLQNFEPASPIGEEKSMFGLEDS